MSESLEQATHKENKMGTMSINKLLISMSLPMMISMLVQALYNIVDSIFVSKISEDALTAVSLAFPLQTLMIGVSVGTAVGVNAVLSRALGAKDYERVNKTAKNGIFLAAVSYLVFLLIGLVLVAPFYHSQADSDVIIGYGIEYLTLVMVCSFGVFAQVMYERLLTSTGRTMLTMVTQGTGAIVNIILDPILIFGLLGAPKMGVRGAALATVCGQVIAAIMAIIFNHKKNPDIEINFKGFRPDPKLIGEIYVVGIPSIIMQCIGSVMTYTMNRILYGFSSTAVAVFGVYFKLQSFIFMPIFGLNGGAVPIIAFNYGAKKKERLVTTWKYAWAYATGIMLLGTVAFELIPNILFSPFSPSQHMISIGVPALRIIGIHFPVAAFCIVTGTLFQALGKSVYSMITSIMRQLVVLIPAAYLLSLIGDVNYVWWAFPIAEVMSCLVTLFFFGKIKKEIINQL